MRLDHMTWKQAESFFQQDPVVLLPVGSVEQHGPIGPLGTDYLIPQELSQRVDNSNTLLLPAIPYGVAPHHQSFPGTIDIGHQLLLDMTSHIADSLLGHGIKRFLFINGHGGNTPALETVCLYIYKKGGLAALIDWWSLAPQLDSAWSGGHGAGQEASAMMAIDPQLIDKSACFSGQVNHLSDKLQNLHLQLIQFGSGTVKIMRDFRHVSETGAYGGSDPSEEACSQKGEAMLSAVAAFIADFIEEFRTLPLLPR